MLTPPAQPVLWSSGLPPNTAPATPNQGSHHQPSLSSGAPNCLRVQRLPRQIHFHTISPACPLELRTASEQGACHAKSILAPSARSPFLSSGLPPITTLATPNSCSRHQPSLSSGAPDCLRAGCLPRQIHSSTIRRACPVELLAASEYGACHAESVPIPSSQPVLWSSGLPPNAAPATPKAFSSHQPSLCSGAYL